MPIRHKTLLELAYELSSLCGRLLIIGCLLTMGRNFTIIFGPWGVAKR